MWKQYVSTDEQFFVFLDRTPVLPHHFRAILKLALRLVGFKQDAYGVHSLRAGRAGDLLKLGFSVETIKKIGRWTSNAVYTYLK